MSTTSVTVIDASGLILGRLASVVAKRLLNGEKIVVINAEKAVVSGSKESVVKKAKARLKTRTLGSQRKAPKHPRRPDRIVRRTVRGMLPWKKPRGKEAYKRLRVYMGVPEDFEEVSPQTLPEAGSIKIMGGLVTVEEIARGVGWRPPGER